MQCYASLLRSQDLVWKLSERSERINWKLYRWQPRDMISWLEKKGVSLKTEEDGRIFPTSNKSQSIIDCLEQFLKSDNVQIRKNCMVRSFKKINSGKTWEVKLENEETLLADRICIATGSIKGSKLIDSLEALGHQITLPVPSLFAFNSLSHELSELSGISVQKVKIQIIGSNFCQEGPILITHKGISGPGVIKLSSWAARELYQRNYRFNVRINWLGMNGLQTAKETIAVCKKILSFIPDKNLSFCQSSQTLVDKTNPPFKHI